MKKIRGVLERTSPAVHEWNIAVYPFREMSCGTVRKSVTRGIPYLTLTYGIYGLGFAKDRRERNSVFHRQEDPG